MSTNSHPLAPNVHMQNGLQGQAVHAAMGEEWDSGLEMGALAVHFPEESSFAQRHLLFAQAGLELMDEIPEILVAVGVPMEGKVPNTTVLEEAGCVVEPHGRVMPLDLPVDDLCIPAVEPTFGQPSRGMEGSPRQQKGPHRGDRFGNRCRTPGSCWTS